jgi:hypothetical protein
LCLIFIFRISRCSFPYLWHSFYNGSKYGSRHIILKKKYDYWWKDTDLKRLTGRLKLRFLTEIGWFHWNQGEEVAHFVWFCKPCTYDAMFRLNSPTQHTVNNIFYQYLIWFSYANYSARDSCNGSFRPWKSVNFSIQQKVLCTSFITQSNITRINNIQNGWQKFRLLYHLIRHHTDRSSNHRH